MAKINSQRALELQRMYLEQTKVVPNYPKGGPDNKSGEEIISFNEGKPVLGLGGIKDFGIYISCVNNTPPLRYMHEKEIVKLIYESYKCCYDNIANSESFGGILQYIKDMKMEEGICRYARMVLGVRCADMDFVQRYNGDNFWFETPKQSDTLIKLKTSIALRVERLKEILESYDKQSET